MSVAILVFIQLSQHLTIHFANIISARKES